jgi:transcriptional regulator with XRE-family HTH domain
LKKDILLTPEQVGQRIKERRGDLGISMPELGRRVGVNKSTIQRYETDGVDPKRTMIINGLAEALLTTPEWLTGLSEEKEYDSKTLCQREIEEHIKKYLDTVTDVVKDEPHQELLTNFLGKIIDLYSVLCHYFADAMAEVDQVAEDEGLKQSLMRYAIESGAITERVYRKEMELPIEDMKRFLDGILHIYDEGRTKVSMGDLFGIVAEAEARLSEKENSVAP